MPKMTVVTFLKSPILAIFAILLASHAAAAESPQSPVSKKYDSGYDTMARIAQDLYRALPAENRRRIVAAPVLLQNVQTPYLEPGESSRTGTNSCAVYVSAGLFEMLNYVAHAKAVDQVDHGFFVKAVNSLA